MNRDIVSALGRIEVTISYQRIIALLHVLAADASSRLQDLAGRVEHSQPTFLLLFDNINKMRRSWQQTVHHRDELQNGTAATFIQLEGVRSGALRSQPLIDNLKKQHRLNKPLTVDALLDDIDWNHVNGIGAATVLRVWVKHLPGLRRFKSKVQELFAKDLAVRRLKLRKSTVLPMRPTAIDESISAGILSVLHNLVLQQLDVHPEWLDKWLVFVCGDQMTIDRLRKTKLYSAKTNTPYDRHDWVLPVIQLWHLKWNWMKAIFCLHWTKEFGKDAYGLRHDVHVLRREKFNSEKCDFYQGHHIIEDRFEAMILEALRCVISILFNPGQCFLTIQQGFASRRL